MLKVKFIRDENYLFGRVLENDLQEETDTAQETDYYIAISRDKNHSQINNGGHDLIIPFRDSMYSQGGYFAYAYDTKIECDEAVNHFVELIKELNHSKKPFNENIKITIAE